MSLRTWALTSATPYDTPLTYGGFNAARSIGIRIASELAASPSSKPRRIIIHTSPFLRCIQTSISLGTQLPTKPLLRIDAWLGEWLSSDYYAEITPPPSSELMVANAKMEYLRPGYLAGNIAPDDGTGAYAPPRPTHAVAVNEGIPEGYVQHARDRLTFDFHWDSARFGDGGELGEEWTSMLKRSRRGFINILNYYCTPESQPSEEEEEEEVDTVLVLVTHGSGANALLGAMTDQPVLRDIGTGSITMGVRTEGTPPRDLPVKFNVPIVASTTHLRNSNTTTATGTPTISAQLAVPPGMGSYTLVSSTGFGTPKVHRSASQGNQQRPTGLWTRPVESPTIIASAKEPFEDVGFRREMLPPPVLEHSGSVLDGEESGCQGLWAAKGWAEGVKAREGKRRWTVGREATWGGMP